MLSERRVVADDAQNQSSLHNNQRQKHKMKVQTPPPKKRQVMCFKLALENNISQ